MGEIRAGKMKNLHHKWMLGLSSLVSICVFFSCWALLMEGAISRLVTNGIDLLSDVLKEEVMWQVEQKQMELEHKINIMVKVLAIASSTLSCFNLMALASITIKSRLTSWLMLPHLFTGSLPAIFFFLLPCLPQLPLLDGRLCPPDRLVPRSPPGVRDPLQPLQDLASSKQVWVESLEEHCPRH